MVLLPQSFGDLERVNVETLPPDDLIADLMQLPVMTTAEGHCEFIADLQAQRPRLRETQMMRVSQKQQFSVQDRPSELDVFGPLGVKARRKNRLIVVKTKTI